MPVERTAGGTSLIDVLDRVLDKGIVIDAWVRVSLVGIDLITVEARVVVASIDTYLKYSEAVGAAATASRPAIEGRTNEDLEAENASLRAQIKSSGGRGERRRRPATPFASGAFHVMPLRGSGGSDEAVGLMLWGGARKITPEIEWFGSVFALKLAQVLRRMALSEGDRKQEYERSLLRAIVNAVTDPILLTDPEGRLLIANARARTLFVASEEESEGRRGAVGMNNMLLSSALSSKAIEETGAMRRELLLVNPSDGSDLLYELLSSVTEDARYGTGTVAILRNVGDLRR